MIGILGGNMTYSKYTIPYLVVCIIHHNSLAVYKLSDQMGGSVLSPGLRFKPFFMS